MTRARFRHPGPWQGFRGGSWSQRRRALRDAFEQETGLHATETGMPKGALVLEALEQ